MSSTGTLEKFLKKYREKHFQKLGTKADTPGRPVFGGQGADYGEEGYLPSPEEQRRDRNVRWHYRRGYAGEVTTSIDPEENAHYGRGARDRQRDEREREAGR